MSSQIVTVTSTTDLHHALNNATSDTTILLAPGDYNSLSYWGTSKDWSNISINIQSQDPSNQAVFTEVFLMREVSNITISDVTFDAENIASTRAVRWIDFYNSSNITMDGVTVIGEAADAVEGLDPYDPAATLSDHVEGFAQGIGLYVNGVDGFTLKNSEFTELRTAMQLRDSTDITIENVHIHNVREGINFTEVTGIDIVNSLFEDFTGWVDFNDPAFDSAVHDHVDMIQFWGVNNVTGVHDVTISNNLFLQPSGSGTQTIFGHMGGTSATATATNFTITDNIIVNSHANAIRIADVQGGLISGNVLLPNSDAVTSNLIPRIQLTGSSSDFIVTDNALVDHWRATTLGVTPETLIDANNVSQNVTLMSMVNTDPNYYGSLTAAQWLAQVASGTGGTTGGSTGGGTTVGDTSGVTDQVLNGGEGNQILVGGAGDDQIMLRLAQDIATGNSGADQFILDWRYVYDGDSHIITDLDFTEGDWLEVRYLGNNKTVIDSQTDLFNLLARSDVSAVDSGSDKILTLDDGSTQVSVTLTGYADSITGGSTGGTGTSGGSTSGGTTTSGTTLGDPASSLDQVLNGGSGDQTILGGSGDDQIMLRLGQDTATGNSGADQFILDWRYVLSGDNHTITDLDFTEYDWLEIRYLDNNKTVIDSQADLDALLTRSDISAVDVGSDKVLTLDDGTTQISVTLTGYADSVTGGGSTSGGGTSGGSTGGTSSSTTLGDPASSTRQVLNGGSGDQTILGGSGNDQIMLRLDNDTATGNAGIDQFILDWRYVQNGDSHIITDLDFAEYDWLEVRYLGNNKTVIDSQADLDLFAARSDVTATTAGSDLLLLLDDGTTQININLQGVSLGSGGGSGGGSGSGTSVPVSTTIIGDSSATTDQVLNGDSGSEDILGGSGDDQILLRLDNDTATGNAGADTFIFDWRYFQDGDSHSVTDLDFTEGDVLEIRFFGGTNKTIIDEASDLATFATQAGVTGIDTDSNYVLYLDDGTSMMTINLDGDFF